MNRFLLKVKDSFSTPLLLALVLLVLCLFNHWQYAVATPTTDFFTYWGVPRVLRVNPVSNIYSREDQGTIFSVLNREAASWGASKKQQDAAAITSRFYGQRVDATGSPFLYALAGLLSTGGYEKDQRHYVVLCFICLIASITILCCVLKYTPFAAVLMLMFFSSFYAPILSDMEVGNCNQIQLFIVSLFILLTVKSKPLWAGIIIGIGMALKPNIAPVWLLYVFSALVDRQYRQQVSSLLGTAAGVLLAVSFSAVYFGKPSLWLQFAGTFQGMLASSYPVANGNMALPMLIAELTGLHVSAVIGGILLVAFAVIVIFTRPSAHGGKNSGFAVYETFAVTGIGCTAMLLAGGLAWLHYYILLIPIMIYLLRPVEGENPRSLLARTAVQGAAAAALLLFSTATPFTLKNPLSQAVIFNIAAVICTLGAFLELRNTRLRSRAGL